MQRVVEQGAQQPGARMRACPMCREQILASAQKCRHCGEYLSPMARRAAGLGPRSVAQAPTEKMPDPMGRALFACLLFLPLGVVAIVFAAQAHSKAGAADYAGATQAAKTSQTLSFAAYAIGLIFLLLFMLSQG